LKRISRSLDAFLRDLSVEAFTADEAVALIRAASAVERKAAAIKTLLAAHAVSGAGWAGEGHRSAEAWLASETGVGYGEAAGTLQASEKLAELPLVAAAVRAGELSGPQTREVAAAATPENSGRLLDVARAGNVDQLRKACGREKASARSNDDERARHAKAHRERFYKSWIDHEGAWRFEGKGTAMDGAMFDAHVAAEADQVFKQAWAEGRRESQAAYRFDALMNMARNGGGGDSAKAPKPPTVVIRVDASRLAGEDGVCETSKGPVPVDEAIGAILAGAFTKVVLRDGVDITKVAHVGRHIPAELKTAVMERDGFCCVRPGCGATQRLEIHHYKVDYAKGGVTSYWNLGTLCRHDHVLVTTGGHELSGGPGAWEWKLPDDRPPP
jgi:hypothetical protein